MTFVQTGGKFLLMSWDSLRQSRHNDFENEWHYISRVIVFLTYAEPVFNLIVLTQDPVLSYLYAVH